MKKHKLILFNVLLIAVSSCRVLTAGVQATENPVGFTDTRTYENEDFIFTIPPGWQTMEEVWKKPMQPDKEFYGLGVQEIISIQYPSEQGKGNSFFAVSTSPMTDGEDLDFRFTQAYENAVPEITEESKQVFEQGTVSGYEITYKRPWGEPWWKFRDIWLEKDFTIYVLSFHTSPDSFVNYDETFALILDSFRFKD